MDIGKSKGKKRKSYGDDSTGNITTLYKKTILFDLPYWKELPIRPNLDVMHVVKNVGDHLLSTILEVKDKSKDDISAREDLKKMNIMKDLWLKEADGKTIKPKASFTLSRKEKELFCQTLHDLKVPTGYSSRFKHLVNLQTFKIKGLKSHDYHVIMCQLLPVLLQHAFSEHKTLRTAIQHICYFFNVLCSKTISADNIIAIKKSVIVVMCVLEKFFPPSFFVISIHLMVHLADEALACGPIRFRWMYPFEWLMKIYKGYVKNTAHPEGCIAERYIVEESILYCMEYMPNGERGSHKHTHQRFLDEDRVCDEEPLDNGKNIYLTNIQHQQVRRWVLHCYDGIYEWKSWSLLRAS
ncbi:uncharacterized protein LOC131251443 isoform X2 [Magnolia sinica]|uniref:uncharacterized protein LOC131251443 isoform X2 n=1 Tax=Magnolia sinica TaxID=86752 RepID=UPI002657C11A|nr:uncharacterized protein LOC131251443 isoform X2 [Magnolia sinica]